MTLLSHVLANYAANLVGAWKLNEASGNGAATDYSGAGHHMALTNGAPSGVSLLGDGSGDTSMTFPSGSIASISHAAWMNGSTLSVFARVKTPASLAGLGSVFQREDQFLIRRQNGTPNFAYGFQWPSYVTAPQPAMAVSTVYSFGLTCTGSLMTFYLNGVASGSIATAALGTPSKPLQIGNYGVEPFLGAIGPVYHWVGRALNATEHADLHTMATTAPVAAPGVPTSVAVTDTQVSALELSWGAPASGGAVATYEVRLDGGPPVTATSPHVFTGLDWDTAYDLEVRARNAGGDSAWVLVTGSTSVPPEGWYLVEIEVGAHSYSAEYGDTPTLGVRLPLTLGWQVPDSVEYFPAQADPTKMTFGLLVDDAADLADVEKGSAVTFSMWVDPTPGAPVWQTFSGVVTQLDGQITDAGRFRVTVYASDDSMRLADMVIGYSGDWAQESIADRIDRITTEAGITWDELLTHGGLDGTLPARTGTTTVLAALRDALKDAASDNTSEPPDEWWGRYVYYYDPDTTTIWVTPFERRVYAGSTLTLDGADVEALGDWVKLPNNSQTATWALVDGTTFGTPSGPPLVRNTQLVDTSPSNPSAQTRDNLGESLLPDGSTQLDGWYSDRITFKSWQNPLPMGPLGLVAGDAVASMAPMRFVYPVVVTPLDIAYELNGEDYLAGTLVGAQLVIPPGGKHVVHLRLRPELLPGTDLP